MLFTIVVVLFCIVLTPVVLVTIPPLVDYPNHMARMHILADAGRSDYLRQYYEIHWDILPNMAMDLIIPLLARLVPLDIAGKIFIGMTMLQLAGGVMALHYALHRRWSWWPLLAVFFLYNSILLWGFLNYLFGLGMALWVFAGWVAFRRCPSWQTVPLFSFLAMLLFFCHLFAFGIYVVVLSGYEAGQWWAGRRSHCRIIDQRLDARYGQPHCPAHSSTALTYLSASRRGIPDVDCRPWSTATILFGSLFNKG